MSDRPVMLRVTDNGLSPADRYSADALAGMKRGDLLRVVQAKRRSLPQLRLYWAVLQKVVEAGAPYPSAEALHVALKLALGVADVIRLPNGKTVPVPRSAGLDAMSAPEFNAFSDKAFDLICQYILPGVEKSALIAEVHDMLGGKAA